MFLTFDVECVGIHGEAFAIGAVLTDGHGVTLDEWCFVCPHYMAEGSAIESKPVEWENRQWVLTNVIPRLPDAEPETRISGINYVQMKFMDVVDNCAKMSKERECDFYLVSDVPFPCEVNFLNACLKAWPSRNSRLMPYPLLDVASMLFAKGYDPTGTYSRLENELPAHNPLNDARQSSRIFHALRKDESIL